jgi:Ca2+-binding RTX toxin-like protein
MSSATTIRAFVLALVLALGVMAAGVGGASAGTLTANGSKVFYEADPGETDKLEIDATSRTIRIESNVTLSVPSGNGCSLSTPPSNVGTCRLSVDATEIRLDLKDGNDEVDTVVSVTQGGVPLYVLAGTGADRIVGGKAADMIFGQPGADTLTGGEGPDRLEGDKDDDTLDGQDGNDFLEGDEGFTAGEDELTGGPGFDTFQGGPGADVLHAKDGVANEPVSCGAGADRAEIDKFFDALGALIASDDTSSC